MPPQPANFGTGNGMLGVLPASSVTCRRLPPSQAHGLSRAGFPYPAQAAQQDGAARPVAPVAHTGWIVQVGALESENEAQQRIDRAQFGPRPAQQGRSVHRARRRQGQSQALPRPLRRARARPGRSGLQGAEARRHFLHHRPQLIHPVIEVKSPRLRGLCCFWRTVKRPNRSAAAPGATKTSRQEFTVNFLKNERSTTPDNGGRTGRRQERSEATRGS